MNEIDGDRVEAPSVLGWKRAIIFQVYQQRVSMVWREVVRRQKVCPQYSRLDVRYYEFE